MSERVSFKDSLINMRQKCGVTQADLETSSGLARTTISHYESGRREPTLDSVEAICIALGCTATELLGF